MLESCKLSFGYPENPLLDAVQFSVRPGELLYLRGNNGSGKTTLIKILAGIVRPDQGEVRYKGEAITKNLSAYQQQICYVGHKLGLNASLTVEENCFFDRCWNTQSAAALPNLLRQFGLEDVYSRPCATLSAGQLRRAALLRLTLSKVRIWLLDEPFNALDGKAAKTLMYCIETHLAQQGTIVLTSHQSLPLKPINYCEYIL